MGNWKIWATTIALTLVALAVWELFLRKPVAGLLTKKDEPPVV